MTLTHYLFFFSSRRRHTRLQGDWSSDVCSSDLGTVRVELDTETFRGPVTRDVTVLTSDPGNPSIRSEERRVGKECRARRWMTNEKKNKTKRTRKEILEKRNDVIR